MAMVRMYCGLATADTSSWLTAAVVDDSGRLLDLRDVSDDPSGYAQLTVALAERSGSSPVAVASDHANHLVTQLLMAASRPLGIADQRATDAFADHFADDASAEEREAPPGRRRAVGLARALQAGAISATARNASPDLSLLKPILAAHSAVIAGRQAAAVALREVLRELYPAALRAYPDPAECVPLAVLDALPEPGLVADPATDHSFDTDLLRELTGTGTIDTASASHAIVALRVAISDTPQRAAQRNLAPMVAATVRHAVSAVRACDSAALALVGTLVERLGAAPPADPTLSPVIPLSSAPSRRPAPVPAAEIPPNRVIPRRSTASAAAAGVGAVAGAAGEYGSAASLGEYGSAAAAFGAHSTEAGSSYRGSTYGTSPGGGPQPDTSPNHPGPAYTPSYAGPGYAALSSDSGGYSTLAGTGPSYPGGPSYGADPGYGGGSSYPSGPSYGGDPSYGASHASPSIPAPRPEPGFPPPGSRADWATAARDSDYANTGGYTPSSAPPYVPSSAPPYVPSGGQSYASSTYQPPPTPPSPYEFATDPLMAPLPPAPVSPAMPVSPARVAPPWLDEQMPPEPPALRLVETRAESYGGGRTGDPLTDPLGFSKLDGPPVLRVIDGGGERGDAGRVGTNGDARSRGTAEQPAADGDLLIFSQTASSAWFTQVDEEHVLDPATASWGEYADEGWRVAEQASRPAVGAETIAGLPRRVPQANLVPGSVLPPSRPLRIVRDPESIAAHTTGYFRGWRRGQEIGGFAVGQRDRAAWEFNREQRAREQGRDTDQRVRRP